MDHTYDPITRFHHFATEKARVSISEGPTGSIVIFKRGPDDAVLIEEAIPTYSKTQKFSRPETPEARRMR